MARIIELIETEQLTGSGTMEDPCRHLAQLWTTDGKLVAEFDPHDSQGWYKPAVYSA